MYNKSMKDLEVRSTIREMHYKQGMSGAAIGTVMGIAPRTVQDYLNGTTWGGEGEQAVTWRDGGLDLSSPARPADIGQVDAAISTILRYMKPERNLENLSDNSRILLISDMHVPYHHPDTLEFLQYLVDKYEPTRVICLGDELDKHALSFHDSDPNLPSAGDELKLSLPVIERLKEMFPVMDILESNHGSLLYRKAHHHGIPKEYLKSYNDVLGVDSNWKWHYDLVVDLPNGNKCYLHHGKASNVTKTSQTMSMCAVQGHFHETFKVEYWGNPVALYWAMQCGCLINDKSYAFNYNNVNLKRPIIGTGLIIDSQPILEPMVLDKNGRWVLRK